MKNLGFIGMGNMAQAIAGGFRRKDRICAENLYAYAPNQEKLHKNAEKIGFVPKASPEALVEAVDTVVIACKPYQVEDVLQKIAPLLPGKTLLSVALGWDYARYASLLPDTVHIQFIMPNTPALVEEGMLLFEETNSLSKEEREEICDLFASVGRVVTLPSHLMGIGGALTGCGPAFVDLMIEALADAAVKYGMPRKEAYALTSQMILGSAKLQLMTGTHPGVLKDAVCSPAGSTIRGVEALEKNGFRAACMEAIRAAVER